MADAKYFEEGTAGNADHLQHRAPAGEGYRSDSTDDSTPPQMSIYDGKGNESVVVLTVDDDGKPSQGAGDTLADALKDAKTADAGLSDAFYDPKH